MDGKEGRSKDLSVRLPPLLARVNDTLLVSEPDFTYVVVCCVHYTVTNR